MTTEAKAYITALRVRTRAAFSASTVRTAN